MMGTRKEYFINHLESIKTDSNKELIEAIKTGFECYIQAQKKIFLEHASEQDIKALKERISKMSSKERYDRKLEIERIYWNAMKSGLMDKNEYNEMLNKSDEYRLLKAPVS